MFQPEHFPLRGHRYHEAVSKLRHITYNNHKMLAHYAEEARPRRWRDVLGRGQDRAFSYIHSPQMWHSTGAEEDFRQALGEVPVLALSLVRPFPQDPAKYIVVSTYNGRTAAFNLPLLEPHSNWFRRSELLPPELRAWLEDDGVFVLVTDSTSPLTNDPDGIQATRTVSTDVLFGVYQHAGVIKPHFKADRGDLSWQMVYATGYHHRPCSRPKFVQFVGEDHFRSAWPEWREPGWLPAGTDSLNPQEEFFLYYEAAGLQLFVNRLLQHGLLYGGMKAVDPTLSLKQLYWVFLEGGENRPWSTRSDPLGIKTDFPSPQQFRSNPALLLYAPQEFQPAEADQDRGAGGDPAAAAPGEKAEDMELEVPPNDTKKSKNDDDEGASHDADSGEGEIVLLLDDQALEHELNQETTERSNKPNNDKDTASSSSVVTIIEKEHTETQKKLLELAQSLPTPPPPPSRSNRRRRRSQPRRRWTLPPPRTPPPPLAAPSPSSPSHRPTLTPSPGQMLPQLAKPLWVRWRGDWALPSAPLLPQDRRGPPGPSGSSLRPRELRLPWQTFPSPKTNHHLPDTAPRMFALASSPRWQTRRRSRRRRPPTPRMARPPSPFATATSTFASAAR